MDKLPVTFCDVRLGSWQMPELRCDLWARAPGYPTAVCPFQSSGASPGWASSKDMLYPIYKVPRPNLLFTSPEFNLFSLFLPVELTEITRECLETLVS